MSLGHGGSGFQTCGPSELMVVSGCCYSKPALIPGGRVFVWPIIMQLDRLSLKTMTLNVESKDVYTDKGVPISITGVAQVKVQGQNREMLDVACEQFLGKSEKQIAVIAMETLEGHQRAIMGNMTVEEIYQDRKKFSKAVFECASSDLVNMGLSVVSYTLRNLTDSQGYLECLGLKRTEEVKRDARIGEAEAQRDAGIKEALAEEQRMAAKYFNDTEIAKAKRDFELMQASYNMEVFAKQAQAELAYSLQEATTKQKIKEEDMQVLVVERAQQIMVQEQEILRKEKELESTVRQPAEAEKYRMETIAEANRKRVILEAQAEADAINMRCEAEAIAITAKGKADAEQLTRKAQAFNEYQDAAIVEMVLDTMPRMAAEVANPLMKVDRVTMVSGGKGDVGVAKLTGEVMDVMERLPRVVEGMTNVSLIKAIKSIKK